MKDQLLESLISAISNLDEVESAIYEYVNTLDVVQNKIMDIEHYLEFNDLTDAARIEFVNLLQYLRKERRQIKQMWEIYNTYGNNRDKLKQKDYRSFLIAELNKTNNRLDTKYRNRVYSEEFLNEINKDRRKPRKLETILAGQLYNNNVEEKSNYDEEE